MPTVAQLRGEWTPFQPNQGDGKSYNMETVLRSNILNSDYYLQLTKTEDFLELVDEIYNEVDHVEPWMSGNARGPSTAFCLLFRLFTLGLSEKNIHQLINHQDSPYIRALGFLYVRYIRDPKEFAKWFDPFLKDSEEFTPSPGAKKVTIGAYVCDLILDQYYFETIFPRIPEVVRRALVERLKKMGCPDKAVGCGGTGGQRRQQEDAGGGRRPPSVKAALSVNLGQRAPHVAAARESGRGIDPTRQGVKNQSMAASNSGAKPVDWYSDDFDNRRGDHRDRDRDRDHRDSRDRDRDRERDRDRDRKERDSKDYRDRDRDHRDYGGRDRDRDRDYDRRDRDRDRDRDHRDRDRDYRDSRDRDPRDSRPGGGYRDYDRRDRDRSPDRRR